MNQGKKIAIIIPYFGQWPEWIDYFLLSCEANPSINWIFPTDCTLPGTQAKNLRFVPYSLTEFNKTANEKTGLDLNIPHPYKICDLKPAYGEIFQDLLDGYDFWGYGDLDLVYGNIREYFPDEFLEEFDIISNHEDFVTGHLCLLKNTPEIIELYKTGNAFISAFSDQYYTGFDEQLKKNKINPNPNYLKDERERDRQVHISGFRLIQKLKRFIPVKFKPSRGHINNAELNDFSSIVREADRKGQIRVSCSKRFESDLMLAKQGERDWEARWSNGSLKNKEAKDLLYFHFILSKDLESFKVMKYDEGINEFRITSEGIIHYKEQGNHP